jgi:hypothetical protein
MEIHYENSKVQEMWRMVQRTYFVDERNFMYNNKNPVLRFRDIETSIRVEYGKMLDSVTDTLSEILSKSTFATTIVLTTDKEIESMHCLTFLFTNRFIAQEKISTLMSGYL